MGVSEASQVRIELGLEEMARAAQRDNEVRRRRSGSRDSSDDPVELLNEAEQRRAEKTLDYTSVVELRSKKSGQETSSAR